MISLLGFLNSHFSGRVIARLPFEPFPLVRSLSHRGLDGNDWTECSMVFLYILCGISFRGNLQKVQLSIYAIYFGVNRLRAAARICATKELARNESFIVWVIKSTSCGVIYLFTLTSYFFPPRGSRGAPISFPLNFTPSTLSIFASNCTFGMALQLS